MIMAGSTSQRAAGRSTPISYTVRASIRFVHITMLKHEIRPYSTNQQVDQPAGTGYSYTSTDSFVHELGDVRSFSFR